MALLQCAVFMYAGSYVMTPKSSGPVLICRRSIARIVPSWIGSSYVFPVRLSVTVSVSGIGIRGQLEGSRLLAPVRVFLGVVALTLPGNPVIAAGPARQILELAAFAAEGAPGGRDRMSPAENAQRGLWHSRYRYSNWARPVIWLFGPYGRPGRA